jgi:hypothetical protein
MRQAGSGRSGIGEKREICLPAMPSAESGLFMSGECLGFDAIDA